ncbi:MAG: hypothetical protein N3F67_02340 [Acidilobaceae archaeon]|nr:hypothetical protein [Acidilobaceae archaeon]
MEVLLGALVAASALFYLLTSLSLFRLHRALGEELFLRLSISFSLLSLGQILMLLSLLSSERLSFSFYTTSTAFALSGYFVMIRTKQALALLSPLVIVPSGLDFLGMLTSGYVSYTSRSYVRAAFAVLSLSHLGRSLGPLLTGLGLLPDLEVLLLLGAEFLKALAAFVLAVRYRKII